MPIATDDPLQWAVLPNAAVEIRLVPGPTRPVIEIAGNHEGLLSLGNLLFWASSDPAEHEFLSITGLSFVKVSARLSLVVVQSLSETETPRMRLIDDDCQFEWHVHDSHLEAVAESTMRVAFAPDGYTPDHFHPELTSASEADLIVGRV